MRAVSREEYHAHIQQFPDRSSSRTGICEPPQEHCIWNGILIGRIVLADPRPREYWIRGSEV
jgi:hypothetical protein